uniref:Putative secretory peptide-64 n=1 Tax=Pleurobrachia bachei TaxID=34499 RepID=M4H2J2_PLEBA|nr:putative secretory peptide-64 [Pleurobrachia bachei]|eukprot:sb/3467617/
MLRFLCLLLLLLGAADAVTFHLRKGNGVKITNHTSSDTVYGSVIVNNSSLLCPPAAGGNYSHDILNVICRESGFVGAVLPAQSHRVSNSRVSCQWAWNMTYVSVKGDCPSNPVHASQCSWDDTDYYERECNIDDTLVVQCTNRRYNLTGFEMLANPAGELSGNLTSKWGTPVAIVYDNKMDTSFKSVIRYAYDGGYYSSRIENLRWSICRYVFGRNTYLRSGYSYSKRHDEVGYQNKLSCGYMMENDVSAMITSIRCNSKYDDPTQCEFHYSATSFYAFEFDDAFNFHCN